MTRLDTQNEKRRENKWKTSIAEYLSALISSIRLTRDEWLQVV